MKIKLLAGCVVGVGKTGKKGQSVEVSAEVGKQLIAMKKAEKPEAKKAEKSD